MNFIKALPFAALLLLTACAPSLTSFEMMPKASVFDQIGSKPALNRNINIGTATVTPGIGGVAPISDEEFKSALVLAMRQAGWYGDKGKYQLDAHLLELDQPIIGFSFTVHSKIEFTLKQRANGKTVYHDILSLPCTVQFAEAFDGQMRLRKATACAVGENITHLLKVLNSKNF
jgi:hypothetical protein